MDPDSLEARRTEAERIEAELAGLTPEQEIVESQVLEPEPPLPSEHASATAAFLAPLGRVLGNTWLHVVALVAACFLVYSNAWDHAFNLDSSHLAVDNLAIRSLSNFASFFTDPGTFSSLKPNVDYRPLLTLSHAIDYALGGYEMRQWHLTQILIHAACVLGLYALTRTLLSRIEGASSAGTRILALVAAAIFAVHPTNCGVVDYISARSSMLTAAFLFPAIVFYVRPQGERAQRTMWLTALFYTLALFTKVEAIGAIGIFLAFEVWQTGVRGGHRRGFLGDLCATLFRGGFAQGAVRDLFLTPWRGWLRRLWPVLAVTAVYWLFVRTPLMADFLYDESSRQQGIDELDYFRTQLHAWWHYVARWFLATEFVADDLSFPVYESWEDVGVWLAGGAWLFVAAILLGTWRRRPQLAFLAVSALAMLFPTSSFRPLSEMVNEHRPYLPLALLSLVWTLPLGRAILRGWPSGPVPVLLGTGGIALLVGGLGQAAHERNRVFLTHEAYWGDVLAKAPSGRAHLNYGRVFMARGELEVALEHFLKSLEYFPYWHVTHVNLAIVYQRLGNAVKAQEHYDTAVDSDEYSGTALTCRGEYYNGLGRWQQAEADFLASLPNSNEHYRNQRGLARARAGLGEVEALRETLDALLAMDAERTRADLEYLTAPLLDSGADPARSAELYRALASSAPDAFWPHQGLATALASLGDADGAYAAVQRLLALDEERVGVAIVPLSTPFFTDPTRLGAGLRFFELLSADLPDTWWVHENIATLARLAGRPERAAEAKARSLELQEE